MQKEIRLAYKRNTKKQLSRNRKQTAENKLKQQVVPLPI